MKIKSRKAFIALCCLILIVSIGVTFALFFSNTSRENIYDLGNFNVVTSETFESPSSWMPGDKINKTITATNNGDISAVFRVRYVERWEDANGNDITSSVSPNTVTINYANENQWYYNSDDGYYYYKNVLKPGDTSGSIISCVSLNENLTGSSSCEMSGNTYNCTSNLSGLAGAHYILTFTKETVSYNKYKAYWSTDYDVNESAVYGGDAVLKSSPFANESYISTVTEFKRYKGKPSSSIISNATIISSNDSLEPIYSWLEGTTLYYWAASPITVIDFSNFFRGFISLEMVDLSYFDVSNAESFGGMFYGCSSLTSLDLSNFETGSSFDFSYMFSGCSSLTSLNLDYLDTSSAHELNAMFYGCSSLTSLDLSNIDVTSGIDFSGMFDGCSSLTSLDLSNWSIDNDAACSNMFRGTNKLSNIIGCGMDGDTQTLIQNEGKTIVCPENGG